MNEAQPEETSARRGSRLYPLLPIVLWAVITALTMYLFPRQGPRPFREFRLGEISPEEIIAPFTFDLLKNDEELEREREQARNSVEPVFVRDDSVSLEMLARLRGSLRSIRRAASAIHSSDTARGPLGPIGRELLDDVRSRFELTLNENAWRYLIDSTRGDTLPVHEPELGTILRDLYSRGVLDVSRGEIEAPEGSIRVIERGEERTLEPERLFDVPSARDEALARLSEQVAPDEAAEDTTLKIAYELLASHIRPNLVFDAAETERRRDRAVAQVPLVKGTVIKNERIIDSNERVTEQHLEKLHSLEAQLEARAGQERGLWQRLFPWLGRFLFAGTLYFFFGLWLIRFHRETWNRANELLLLWALFVVMIAVYGFVFARYDVNLFLYPAALGAMIITIAFHARIGLLFSLILALIIGGLEGRDLISALAILLPASLSLFAVLRVRTRFQIMRSAALIFAGAALVILIDRTITLQFDETMVAAFGYAAISALGTPLIALGLLMLVEPLFKVTSDLTLLELADLNRPLLKKLSLEAPGTYHHSIMVGNLAEAAAEKIQANPLLVRAGAYYHDVGKMNLRDYFVENQPDQGNIHDSIDPEESAQMLARHVTAGVEVADNFRVPEKIKEFICEHHGTSLMVYFYNKALELRPEGKVREEDFRYPGPKPQSKETGILMLADSAEAATRSIDDPSEENIRNIVREVIINKYRDGELDKCPLTMHDLGQVMEAFVPILQGMHHHRIRYPSREELETRREQSKARQAKKAEAEAGESGS